MDELPPDDPPGRSSSLGQRVRRIPVPDIPMHEFEPCTGSAVNMRARVTQGQALPVERGEPFMPGNVLEPSGAVTGDVDAQSTCAAGSGRVRHPRRCAVVRLDPTTNLVVISGDVSVRSLYGHRSVYGSQSPWAGSSRIGGFRAYPQWQQPNPVGNRGRRGPASDCPTLRSTKRRTTHPAPRRPRIPAAHHFSSGARARHGGVHDAETCRRQRTFYRRVWP